MEKLLENYMDAGGESDASPVVNKRMLLEDCDDELYISDSERMQLDSDDDSEEGDDEVQVNNELRRGSKAYRENQ